MSEVWGAKAKTKVTAEDKRMIARRKVQTGHSEDMVAVCEKNFELPILHMRTMYMIT